MSNVSLCKWVTFQKVEIILIFFLRNYLTFKYIYNSWLLLGNSNFRKPHVRSLTSSGCRWAWQPQLPHPCPATQPRLLHPWAELVPGLASAPQPCTEEAVPSASQTGPSLQGAAVWEAFWVGSLDCSVCTHMHVCTPRAFSMLKCHQLLSLPTPEQAREGQVSRVLGYLFSPGWACPMWGLNKSRAGRLPYSATSGLAVAPVFPSLDYHFKLHSSLLLFESSDHHPAFAPYFLTSPDSFSHLPARTQSAPESRCSLPPSACAAGSPSHHVLLPPLPTSLPDDVLVTFPQPTCPYIQHRAPRAPRLPARSLLCRAPRPFRVRGPSAPRRNSSIQEAGLRAKAPPSGQMQSATGGWASSDTGAQRAQQGGHSAGPRQLRLSRKVHHVLPHPKTRFYTFCFLHPDPTSAVQDPKTSFSERSASSSCTRTSR